MLDRLDHAGRPREHAKDDDPDVDVVQWRVVARDHRLWVRGPDDDDFGLVRVGRGGRVHQGDRPAGRSGDRAVLRRGERAAVVARGARADAGERCRCSSTAWSRSPATRTSSTRWCARCCCGWPCDHSPAEVQLVAGCFGRGREHLEAWLRWLPHCTTRSGGGRPWRWGPRATAAARGPRRRGRRRGRTRSAWSTRLPASPRRTVEAVAAAPPRARAAPGLARPRRRRGARRHGRARRPAHRPVGAGRPPRHGPPRHRRRRHPRPRLAQRPLR